jgi:hypothetical protein
LPAFKAREALPARFWRTDFPPMHGKIACKYVSIHCTILLVRTKIRFAKTALHLPWSNIPGIFVTTDAAMLT